MMEKTFSHYKILEKLGEGGMGIVYKAQDTKLQRLVALKFLREQFVFDETSKARFLREARSASALNHLNIVTIYEIDELEGKYFIAMEYVEGSSLKDLTSQKPLQVKKALDIAIQVADALKSTHEKKVIHRDLKSDNILVTSDGIVKIADFGLAKLRDASTITTQPSMMGTLPYISPEQLKGDVTDERTDIFSFGVVLYEMLTGVLPFRGDYGEAILYSILNEEPDPITKVDSKIPVELERVIRKSLEKIPEFRYQSMREILVDLKKISREYEKTTFRLAPTLPSLAVLHFDNLGEKKEDDYFAAGVTEDIITDLSKIDKIKVLSRSDVLPFKDKAASIKEVGRTLNVDYVLEGSVRKADKKLRVTAQLIRVSDGFHVWAERFDRELEDVFEVQSDVSQKVAQALEVRLTRSQIDRIEKKPTIDIKAYDYYLKGRDYYWRLGKEELEFAIQMYKKALEVDPQYALAYAGLADTYAYQYEAYYDRSLSLLDKAEETSKRALALDYDLPEAHRALGRVYKEKRDYQESIGEFKKAIELKPDFFEAHRALGWIYEEMRSFDDSITHAEKALEIRSSDRESWVLLGIAHLDKKDYSQAEKMFFKALETAPDYGTAYYYIGQTYQKRGKFNKALEMYEKCVNVGGDPNVYLDIGWVYLMKKSLRKATVAFKKCIEICQFEFLAYYYLGLINEIQGKKEKPEEYYNQSVQLSRKILEDDPNNPYINSTLGLAYTALENYEEGLAKGEYAVSLDPDNGAILYDLARIYALQNKSERAVHILEKALEKCLSPTAKEAKLDPHFKDLLNNPAFISLVSS